MSVKEYHFFCWSKEFMIGSVTLASPASFPPPGMSSGASSMLRNCAPELPLFLSLSLFLWQSSQVGWWVERTVSRRLITEKREF